MTEKRYTFLFAVVLRRKSTVYNSRDRSVPPRHEMYSPALSDAFYLKLRDNRVLPTSEHTAKLNACALKRDYSELDA
jgi:hypothetical protein